MLVAVRIGHHSMTLLTYNCYDLCNIYEEKLLFIIICENGKNIYLGFKGPNS